MVQKKRRGFFFDLKHMNISSWALIKNVIVDLLIQELIGESRPAGLSSGNMNH
jgi:hypothetical protein